MTEERWLPVVGWEGQYEVSDLGRVRNVLAGPGRRVGWVLAQGLNEDGYPTVGLQVDRVRRIARVHRLVGDAFFGALPLGLMTRHLDGDKTNNCVSNLRYGTNSENQLDSVRHGTNRASRVTECPAGHPYDAANTYVTPRGKRDCRACRREATRRSHERRRARSTKRVAA